MKPTFKFTPEEEENFKIIYKFAEAKKVKLYLVGGTLRDFLLNRQKENPDFDFCLKRAAINFGRALSRKVKAGFVVLDKEHGACRLVKQLNQKMYTFDFTDFRGKDLADDLLHRDFTINAMALRLEDVFLSNGFKNAIIDPWAGRKDLENKLIRVADDSAFNQDPLRILRAFSFSSILGFAIDKQTLKLAKLHRDKLSSVSAERIRDELFKIFNNPDTFRYILMLDELKILKVIFPEIEKMRAVNQGPYHHLDILKHSFEALRQIGGIFEETKRNNELKAYINEYVAADRKRSALLKLAAFLHDIGKPAALRRQGRKIKFHGHERIGKFITEDIARRLKLSVGEINLLKNLVFWHLRPGYLADNEPLTARALFRYFRDTGNEAVSVLLLSLADQRATRGRLTTAESRLRHEKVCAALIKEYFRRKKEKKIPRLLNGDIIIKKFKLASSPLIGEILSTVEELQAIGRIKTKTQALQVAAKLIKRRPFTAGSIH